MIRGLAITFGVWAAGALLLRLLIVPGQHCPPITDAGALAGAQEAAGWVTAAQRPDGSYLYE